MEDLGLMYEDKCILTTRAPITASICNAAMQLIRSNTATISGLQSIDKVEMYQSDGRKFIQIVPLSQKLSGILTWETLSNVVSEEGHVTLYDAARRMRYV